MTKDFPDTRFFNKQFRRFARLGQADKPVICNYIDIFIANQVGNFCVIKMIRPIQGRKHRSNIPLRIRGGLTQRIKRRTETSTVYHIGMFRFIGKQAGECRRQMPAQTVPRRRYLAYGDAQAQPPLVPKLVKVVGTRPFNKLYFTGIHKQPFRIWINVPYST